MTRFKEGLWWHKGQAYSHNVLLPAILASTHMTMLKAIQDKKSKSNTKIRKIRRAQNQLLMCTMAAHGIDLETIADVVHVKQSTVARTIENRIEDAIQSTTLSY